MEGLFREEKIGASHDNPLIVILLGCAGVGKASAVRRICDGFFCDEVDHVPEETRLMFMGGLHVKLLFDNDYCEELQRQLMRTAHYALLMFSVTDSSGLQSIERFAFMAKKVKDSALPFIVVGTKIDLADERRVSQEEAQEFAMEYGAVYMEISSKSGEGVEQVFQQAIEQSRQLYDVACVNDKSNRTKKNCVVQ